MPMSWATPLWYSRDSSDQSADQILMNLYPKFENVRSNLIGRQPSPFLETSLNEILHKEQRQGTQIQLTHQTSNGPIEVAYAVKRRPKGQGAPKRDLNKIKCYSSKEYGHSLT